MISLASIFLHLFAAVDSYYLKCPAITSRPNMLPIARFCLRWTKNEQSTSRYYLRLRVTSIVALSEHPIPLMLMS